VLRHESPDRRYGSRCESLGDSPRICRAILDEESSSAEEVEKVLRVAFVVWNAVVYDAVHGNTEWVARLRKQVAHDASISALIEALITRQQAVFGHDLRLVGNYGVVEKHGEWRAARRGEVAD
jgi:hypothetical protein